MGMFERKKTQEQIEEETELNRAKAESARYEAEYEERRAVIAQLRKEYGRDWKKILGVSQLTDIQSLRSFLRGANQGLKKASVPPDTYKKALWG